MKIIHREESYAVMGACFEVYKEKGCGFLESVYQECLALEFELRNVPFSSQPALHLRYKGIPLKHEYVPDFICFDRIVMELKAVSRLADEHRAQLHNYLRATGHHLGLLINFGHYPKVQYERIAY